LERPPATVVSPAEGYFFLKSEVKVTRAAVGQGKAEEVTAAPLSREAIALSRIFAVADAM
jgi:hypothetical protein